MYKSLEHLLFYKKGQSSQVNVLIVEENAEERLIYRHHIETDLRLDYRVLETGDIDEAIAIWQSKPLDLILLALTDDKGLGFLEAISKSAIAIELPVILLMETGDEDLAVSAITMGATDYLMKDEVSPNTLRRSIYRTLDRLNLFRQLQRSQRQETLIAEIALNVRQSLNLTQIYEAIVTDVKNFLQADRTIIYKFNPNMSGTIVAEAVDLPWDKSLNQNIIDTCFRHNTGGAYRQGRIFAANDILNANLTPCHIQLLQRFQVKANLVVPILLRQHDPYGETLLEPEMPLLAEENDHDSFLWGLLIVHQCRSTRNWEDLDLRLLQQLSVQLAIAISQAELYQNLQRLNTSLEEKVKQRTIELENNQLKLQQREQLLSISFDNAPVGMAILSLEGKFLTVNQNLCDICGYKAIELLQMSAFDIIHTDFLQITKDGFNSLIDGTNTNICLDKKYIQSNGALVDVICRVSLIRSSSNEPVQFVITIEDVTDKKQNESKLASARAAEAANKAKSEFLAAMSHELRTPMNAVIGMSGLLSNTSLSAQQQQYISIIRHGGEALLSVINKILDFSQIESGNLLLDEHIFNLHQLIEEVLNLMSSAASQKGLELSALINLNVPTQIKTDSTSLRQILVNLLNNAIKFTEQGEVALEVKLVQPNQLEFTLRDTGIGIEPEAIARLFRPFSQADGSITRRYGGTGLGLAICRQLCELMGGEITVESELGIGTTFKFSISFQAVNPSLNNLKTITTQPFQHAESYSSQQSDLGMPLEQLKDKRLLVVNSNASVFKVIQTYTQDAWGMKIDRVNSAIATLQSLSSQEFDVVLIDLNISVDRNLSIAEVLDLSKDIHSVLPSLPIIALVAITTQSDFNLSHMRECITKPITPSKLRQALSSIFINPTSDSVAHLPISSLPISSLPISSLPISTEEVQPCLTTLATANITPHIYTQLTAPKMAESIDNNDWNWDWDLDREFASQHPFRLLIVEDNLVNQQILLLMLERLGYDVLAVNNGMEAVELLKGQSYDLIFMDIQMPVMDGLTACSHIRKIPDRHPWIIGLSANAFSECRDDAIAAGMDDYLTKPLQIEQLAEILHTFSKHCRLPQQAQNPEYAVNLSGDHSSMPKTSGRSRHKLEPLSESLLKPQRDSTSNIDHSMTHYGIYFQTDFALSGLDVIDMSVIRRLEEHLGKVGLMEILESYLSESEKSVAQIQSSFSVLDFKQIVFYIHSLKGGSGTVGANRVAAICKEINSICKLPVHGSKVETIEIMLQQLEVEFAKVAQFIRQQLP